MADEPPSSGNRQRNGKLRIPLPFEEAVRAATEVPADKLAKPESKRKRRKKLPQK